MLSVILSRDVSDLYAEAEASPMLQPGVAWIQARSMQHGYWFVNGGIEFGVCCVCAVCGSPAVLHFLFGADYCTVVTIPLSGWAVDEAADMYKEMIQSYEAKWQELLQERCYPNGYNKHAHKFVTNKTCAIPALPYYNVYHNGDPIFPESCAEACGEEEKSLLWNAVLASMTTVSDLASRTPPVYPTSSGFGKAFIKVLRKQHMEGAGMDIRVTEAQPRSPFHLIPRKLVQFTPNGDSNPIMDVWNVINPGINIASLNHSSGLRQLIGKWRYEMDLDGTVLPRNYFQILLEKDQLVWPGAYEPQCLH